MAISIFLIIGIHIGSTRFLEVGSLNAKYDSKRKLCEGYISIDWGDNGKIKEAIAVNNNKDNDEKDYQKKIGN